VQDLRRGLQGAVVMKRIREAINAYRMCRKLGQSRLGSLESAWAALMQ